MSRGQMRPKLFGINGLEGDECRVAPQEHHTHCVVWGWKQGLCLKSHTYVSEL